MPVETLLVAMGMEFLKGIAFGFGLLPALSFARRMLNK